MFFRKRRRHPLPKFPEQVIPTFRDLCEELTLEEVKQLEPEVDRCIENFEMLSKSYPQLNLGMAYQIAERARYLLKHYADFDSDERKLVMGAVRYFAVAEDPQSEKAFASGFHDDAKVMNHVLELLGLEELCLRV